MSLGYVLWNRSHRLDSTFHYVKPVITERGSFGMPFADHWAKGWTCVFQSSKDGKNQISEVSLC